LLPPRLTLTYFHPWVDGSTGNELPYYKRTGNELPYY
jgi:hypothetical protein